MKGLVLAGFLDYVRDVSGIIGLEELLSDVELPSGGSTQRLVRTTHQSSACSSLARRRGRVLGLGMFWLPLAHGSSRP